MPGVYVWGIGKFDRAETVRTQPALNVPGSYWLSHKQNIYKFTFKYNEPMRDTKEFLYKNELMKVIRRIIKCPPSQGQLNTVHLSITYKHTFWTRQDKMFAMLKFRSKQSTSAFRYAFLLTISVVDDPGNQINDVVIKKDTESECKDANPIETWQDLPDLPEIGPLTPQTEDGNHFDEGSKHSNLSNNFTHPTTNTGVTDACHESLTGTNSSNESLNISEPLKTTTRSTRNRTRRRRDTWASSRESRPTERYNNHSKPDVTPTNAIFDDCQKSLSQRFSNTRAYSKCSTTGKGTERHEIRQIRLDSEPITPRSSNITDQVMEGLMFTIKEVENNVEVVEQRTKMELDEVLENSEKVETKEGERCLVNSSLLRLENLVTKIEVSDKHLRDRNILNTAPVTNSSTLVSRHSVPIHNRLTMYPAHQEQSLTPISCMSRSPFRSSLKSNFDNPIEYKVLNEYSPGTGTTANQGENVTKEYIKNSTGQEMKRFVPPEDNGQYTKSSSVIENNEPEEHFSGTSSYINDNDTNNNNNNNRTNNVNNDHDDGDDTRNSENREVQIDMWKLVQDITRGVKVMVERISDTDIRNATRSSKIPVTTSACTGRRILTRSQK